MEKFPPHIDRRCTLLYMTTDPARLAKLRLAMPKQFDRLGAKVEIEEGPRTYLQIYIDGKAAGLVSPAWSDEFIWAHVLREWLEHWPRRSVIMRAADPQ